MRRARTLLILLLLLAALVSLPLSADERPGLTNESVLTMVKAGLSEELVIAKIQQAPKVEFRLEVDDLLYLKQQKVPEAVIKAMLDRTSRPPMALQPAPASANSAAPGANAFESQLAYQSEVLGIETIRAALVTPEGSVPLRIVRGELSTTAMGIMVFIDYPGLRARVRTTSKHPALLIQSSTPLTGGRYFLAKLDSDTNDGIRSLKVSSAKGRLKAMFGSSRGFMEPDHDWVVEWAAEEAGENLWKVTPKSDLAPGEYGWYVDMGTGQQQTGLYDFGVD